MPNKSARQSLPNVSWIWGAAFATLSFVPTYYLPQLLVVGIGPLQVSISKYLPAILSMTLLGYEALCPSRYGAPSRHWPPSTKWVIVMMSIWTVSLAGADFAGFGLAKLFYYSISGVLVFVVATQVKPSHVEGLLRVVVVIGTCVAAYGLLEYVLGFSPLYGHTFEIRNDVYSGGGRASSTIGNAVALGGYLVLVAPLSVHFARQNRTVGLVSAAVVLAAIATTFARSAWLALAFSLIVMLRPRVLWLTRLFQRFHRGILAAVILIGLSFPAANHFLGPRFEEAPSRVLQRLASMTDVLETEKFRIAQYGTAVNVLEQHPWLGIGFGHLTRLFDVYKSSDTPEGPVRTTENQLLMVVCETGVLGLIVYLLLLGSVFSSLTAGGPAGIATEGLRVALLASFCAGLVNMLFWDALNFPANRFTFWMLAGLGIALAGREGGEWEES